MKINICWSSLSASNHHFTAKFCTSPFLSSSSLKSIFTTFLSESSSSFMLSFCNSVIKSFVAINRKSLSFEVIYTNKTIRYRRLWSQPNSEKRKAPAHLLEKIRYLIGYTSHFDRFFSLFDTTNVLLQKIERTNLILWKTDWETFDRIMEIENSTNEFSDRAPTRIKKAGWPFNYLLNMQIFIRSFTYFYEVLYILQKKIYKQQEK